MGVVSLVLMVVLGDPPTPSSENPVPQQTAETPPQTDPFAPPAAWPAATDASSDTLGTWQSPEQTQGGEDSAVQLSWGGEVASRLFYRVQDKGTGPFYARSEQPTGVARYETTLKLKMEAQMGGAMGVADIDFDWLGYPQPVGATRPLGELSNRQDINNVRLEAHSLYVDLADFVVEGLDLRVGQQVVQWGVGDQFNPTNTLNPEDLENVLMFGKQAANAMVRADYSVGGLWSVSAVVVPVFKPAILPKSSIVGAVQTDRLPFIDEASRLRLHVERELSLDVGAPTIVRGVSVAEPDTSIENMQAMLRIAGAVGEHDFAFSYYRGRNDFPVPILNETGQDITQRCDPASPTTCFANFIVTDSTLAYPEMHVIGLNATGELPGAVGYRFELGAFIPERLRTRIFNDDITIGGLGRAAGEYPYITADGGPLHVLRPHTFFKWSLGLDYTVNERVYVNAIWVHGMTDEFGAGDWLHPGVDTRTGFVDPNFTAFGCLSGNPDIVDQCAVEITRPRLGDFLVFGADFKFHEQRGLFRLFAIWELSGYTRRFYDATLGRRTSLWNSPVSSEGFSAVIFPELQYNFGNGFQLAAGAILQLGKEHTKFGDPAAGGSFAFTRAQFSY